MVGSELIVALFALVFLAFCLTAIALIAMSKNKDDIADHSVSSLRDLKLGNLQKEPDSEDKSEAEEREDTAVSENDNTPND